MKLREVRFVDGASVHNVGGSETERLQSWDQSDSRSYAGDLRLEDGYIRWGAKFAPMGNARQMEAAVEGGKRR